MSVDSSARWATELLTQARTLLKAAHGFVELLEKIEPPRGDQMPMPGDVLDEKRSSDEGMALKEMRIWLGMNLDQMGDSLGISSSNLSRIERGQAMPNGVRSLFILMNNARCRGWSCYEISAILHKPDMAERISMLADASSRSPTTKHSWT